MSILLTPASWFQIPRVGVGPEVVAFWVAVKVKPHSVTLDLRGGEAEWGEGGADARHFIMQWPRSAVLSQMRRSRTLPYLCHGENAEQRRVTGVKPLQLHPHLKTIPALRK